MEELKNIDTVAVATKVPKWLAERFKAICEVQGQSMYDVLQKLLELYLLSADSSTNVAPEMESLIHTFQHIAGWRNQFTLADEKIRITEATYYMAAPERTGHRAMHISEPFFGEWESTFNVATILERCLSLTLPEQYKMLRRIGAHEECQSALETIDILSRQYLQQHNLKYAGIEEEFEDNRRHDFGRQMADAPFVRHQRRGMTNERDRKAADMTAEEIEQIMDERQMKIDFDELPEDDTDNESEDDGSL